MIERIAIQQPSFMSWLGYFEQMDHVDRFFFFDDVQYSKKSWRSRNRIRLGDEAKFIVVPVANAHRPLPAIKDTLILENGWRRKLLRTLANVYAKAPYFDEVYPFAERLLSEDTDNLGELNIRQATAIARWIGIDTRLARTGDIPKAEGMDSSQRIIEICRDCGATRLYNGQLAKTILDDAQFRRAGITLEYQAFNHPEYPQLGEGFISHLSILDALFCVGRAACLDLIRSGRADPDIF